MRFSSNIASLVPSPTLAISARAKQMRAAGESVIDLSAGEPSFPTPDPGIRGGLDYVASGKAGYPPTAGTAELRAAIAAYVNESTRHAHVEAADVVVSNGVKQGLFNASFCLLQPGDEVLIPAPYWPSYLAIVQLAGASPIVVPTLWEADFQLDVAQLEQRRTANTRALFLNSPSNPAGSTYSLELVREVCQWAREHDVWIIADEIYRRLCYGGEGAASVLDVEPRSEKVVHLDGMSKAFSMPGWRIGYAVGPRELMSKMSALQSQTTSGASGPAQSAAAAVLSSPDRDRIIRDFLETLERRRRTAVEALRGLAGLDVRPPAGAIYVYARLTSTTDSMAVAESLLANAGVACVPGEPFGTPGFLRFNYSVADDQLEEGLARIVAFFS